MSESKQMSQQEAEAIMSDIYKLRVITERSGILSDPQIKHLKMWPYVLFAIKDNTVEADEVHRTLVFDLTFSKNVPKDVHNLAKTLENWVWEILGKQYRMTIKNSRNGKVLYRGDRGVEWTPPKELSNEGD